MNKNNLLRRAQFLICGLVALGVLPVRAQTQSPSDFQRHGIAARVSESRGAIAWRDAQGETIIIAIARDRRNGVRCSLLLINARDGQTQQFWFQPERGGETFNGDSFAMMVASNNRLYTAFDNTFVEFDLTRRQWTWSGTISADPSDTPMCFAQAPDGKIYGASYPQNKLFCFDPVTRTLVEQAQLDTREQYPMSLAAGDDGWIYVGIGTARSDIVAFHPPTQKLISLAAPAQRETGNGRVVSAEDGQVYGQVAPSAPWHKLENGAALPGDFKSAPRAADTGAIRWSHMQRAFPSGGRIVTFDLPAKTATVELEGKTRELRFDYDSHGANITSITDGPDGKIYGSTSHPMRVFAFDAAQNELQNLGGIARVASGNFPAWATSRKYLVGAS